MAVIAQHKARVQPVAKGKGRPPVGRQINFRASHETADRLERVARALDLDVSSLVRMILAEHLTEYEARLTDRPQKPKPE